MELIETLQTLASPVVVNHYIFRMVLCETNDHSTTINCNFEIGITEVIFTVNKHLNLNPMQYIFVYYRILPNLLD